LGVTEEGIDGDFTREEINTRGSGEKEDNKRSNNGMSVSEQTQAQLSATTMN
jgi:hypothetical protein